MSKINKKSKISDKLYPWIFGNPMPIAGVVISNTGERMTIKDAGEKSIINQGLAVALFECQAANGFIIDGLSGELFTIADAEKAGMLPKRRESMIQRADKAINGFEFKNSDGQIETTKSLYEAMKKKIIPHEHGLRLFEAQLATGGLIDTEKNYRVSLETAVQIQLISQEIADELNDQTSPVFKGFVDQNTGENLTFRQLLKRCIPDEITGLPMIPARHDSLTNATSVQEFR